jgi:indolepyruvate ferredoxin oxidoreductase, beta subunit
VDVGIQQIAVSGVGGQGVLFVTKLLADTAIECGYSVLISETHGMAQRGGNVISHLKISGGTAEGVPLRSPLIRPGKADLLLLLHPDGLVIHRHYLRSGGTIYSNRCIESSDDAGQEEAAIDANGIAAALGAPVCANLVMLGFVAGSGRLFCPAETLEATLHQLGGQRAAINMAAFRAGLSQAGQRRWE